MTWRDLDAIRALISTDKPYKIGLEQVGSVHLTDGATLTSDKLLVVTMYYSDPRGDEDYTSRYLVGSSLSGGSAIRLQD